MRYKHNFRIYKSFWEAINMSVLNADRNKERKIKVFLELILLYIFTI